MTGFVLVLTLIFTLQSIIILNGRKGTLFTTTLEKEANADRIFTAEDGLQFAIGIIDYGSDDFEDMEGRNFNNYLYLWVEMEYYAEDDTTIVPEDFELETHRCTDEELGLSDTSSSKFYAHSKSSLVAIQGRSHVFHCFD